MQIPFSPPYIDPEIEQEVLSALRSGWITSGPKVRELEKLLCSQFEIPETVTCNSGTSAIMLTLHWFGISKGDEVIIPAYTYSATALAVHHAGATPVFVDVGADFNMDTSKLSDALSTKTKAIIPVDLGGWPANYAEISHILQNIPFQPANETQEKLNRPLMLADAAHSIGSKYNGRKSGNMADITIFSFHAVKNVTTAEGGAICLHLPKPFDNTEVAKTLKLWTLNGQTKDAFTKTNSGNWKYDIVYPGFKMNMPDVLAAIGLAQLRIYESELLPKRIEIFKRYNEAFSKYEWAQLPPFDSGSKKSSCHLYMLRIKGISEKARDRIIDYISQKDVAVNVHFIPLPMLTVFRERGYDINDYPVAYDNYSREISLPIYPQLTNEQVEYVIESVVQSVVKVLADAPPSSLKPAAPPQSPKGEVHPQNSIQSERWLAPSGVGGTTAEGSEMHHGASNRLFSFSRELRDHETPAEKLLWSHLRNNKLGVKFRRQHPIGNYIADFYCHHTRLVIELDGEYHDSKEQKEQDELRDQALHDLGIKVLRFENVMVLDKVDNVIDQIKKTLSSKIP